MALAFHRIKIADSFHQHSLVTREAAIILFARISESNHSRILIDFDGVSFVSRSFADQFIKERLAALSHHNVVEMENVDSNVLKMLGAAATTQNNRVRLEESAATTPFISRKELKGFLLSI
jgi:hypothetical protein